MTNDAATLDRYDYYRGPKALDDCWALKRGGLTLRCTLSTHRLGWQLRLTTGASFSRTQICNTEADVSTTADAWRAEALKQGWQEA